ncbi:MAG: hypothetical protein WA151_03255 [Desulfatirhabdiaceae bacterium]
MIYVSDEKSTDGIAKVVYTSKDRKTRKVFNALGWLARLVTHIPGRYEQTFVTTVRRNMLCLYQVEGDISDLNYCLYFD